MAMNGDYTALEIGDQAALTTQTFVAGRAVAKESTGIRPPSAATVRVLGLVKENEIAGVVEEITGGSGVGGSNKASVLALGVATVQQVTYNGTSYPVYNEALTYAVGDAMYATLSTGILTNAVQAGVAANGLSGLFVGRVLKVPTNAANGDPMQITVGF